MASDVPATVGPFSDFVVYVDESGDHHLGNRINPHFPVFVLAFFIVRKGDYPAGLSAPLQALKFRYFGHDLVVFHEREIRLATGPFSILRVPSCRESFHSDLTKLVENAPFTLIAAAIDKKRYEARYPSPDNPYPLALKFCLERLYRYLEREDPAEIGGITHVVVEQRGRKEDDQLELAFRRICDRQNYLGKVFPFEIVFASKQSNSAGLQVADLVARPIGRHVIDPRQKNRAWETLMRKFRTGPRGIGGYGLKIFPGP